MTEAILTGALWGLAIYTVGYGILALAVFAEQLLMRDLGDDQ